MALDDQFPGLLDFIVKRDPIVTGNFEVSIINNGQLLHSKKNGHGFCVSDSERQVVYNKIQAFIDSQK